MSIMFTHQFFHFYIAGKLTTNASLIFLVTLSLSLTYCYLTKLYQPFTFKRGNQE